MPLEQGPELWRQGAPRRVLLQRAEQALLLRRGVLLAGYYYNGQNKPCYFGAVYEHLDDDLSCEGTIGLRSASEVAFEDDGHAMAWAMAHTED